MKNNKYDNNIPPIISYFNADILRLKIFKDNNNKSGIYR